MLQLRVLHNLGNISSILSDPARAFIVMRDSMKFRIKMQNKVTARNFLRRCLKKSVGTNEIEGLAKKNIYGSVDKEEHPRNKQIEGEVK